MHNFQVAFSPPCLPSSRVTNQEMNSSLHQQNSILSATFPISSSSTTFENTSISSAINPAAVAVNLSSPQFNIVQTNLSSMSTSNMNQLHNFTTAGIPTDPFASFPSSLTSGEFSAPAAPVVSAPTTSNDPFPSAASFLNFIEEGQKMETKFTSILLESAIKLSSLTNTSIFVMVETAHGGRKWAGRNSLRENFLRGTLKVSHGDEELTTEESEKHISSFAFKPTKELPTASTSNRDAVFPQPSASTASSQNPQEQPQPGHQRSSSSVSQNPLNVGTANSNAASSSSKLVSPSSSSLEEGTVVGIQAFTLPTESTSSETPSSSTQSLSNFLSTGGENGGVGRSNSGGNPDGAANGGNQESSHQPLQSSSSGQPAGSSSSTHNDSQDNAYKQSPRKDLNSDFLDDASPNKREESGKSPSSTASASSSTPLQPAPLLASVSEQIRYMSSQLKMTPDQITNVLGLPLTYVQNQVILLNSVNRSSSKTNAAHAPNSDPTGEFLSPNQSVVPAYVNRGNGRGAPGRGRQRVDVNRMRTLLTQRVPVKDIASEMGVSRLCVYYWMQKFGINAYSRRSWTSSDQEISLTNDNSNEIHNGVDSGVGAVGGFQEGSQSSSSSSVGPLVPIPGQQHQQHLQQQHPLPSYMNSSPSRSQSGHIGRPRGAHNKVDINLFKQLVTRKVPVGEIASEFGISRLAVYYHMHKLGFKPYMRPGRARGRGGLPGNRGAGVTMGLTAAGGIGFGGSSFGVRGVGDAGNPGAIPNVPRSNLASASASFNDADPLGAFQHPNPHRGFFEMSPGGLPTMVGYSNMGRFPGFPGVGTSGGGGERSGVGAAAPNTGAGIDDVNSYSDEEVESNLDDIKIEEGVEMDDVVGDEDATGSGIGDEEEDEDDSGGPNHADPMVSLDDSFH